MEKRRCLALNARIPLSLLRGASECSLVPPLPSHCFLLFGYIYLCLLTFLSFFFSFFSKQYSLFFSKESWKIVYPRVVRLPLTPTLNTSLNSTVMWGYSNFPQMAKTVSISKYQSQLTSLDSNPPLGVLFSPLGTRIFRPANVIF